MAKIFDMKEFNRLHDIVSIEHYGDLALTEEGRAEYVSATRKLMTFIGVSEDEFASAFGKSKHTIKSYGIRTTSKMHRPIPHRDFMRLAAIAGYYLGERFWKRTRNEAA